MATVSNNGASVLLTVTEEAAGKRLDQAVADIAQVTRSAAARLIADGHVTVNGRCASKHEKLRDGDCVQVTLPEPKPSEAAPQELPLDIVYEDTDLIVVNKPCGMVVHPAAGNPDGTLVNALLWHCGNTLSGVGGVARPGIVHRIDKDTSGLLAVAKNDSTHLALAAELKCHRINRIYYAVAIGNLHGESGTVDAPIGRHPVDRKKMAVIRDTARKSRNAVTHWRVLARGEGDGAAFSLLRCELETGRTHQIRVHLASIGHPLLGDPVYGGNHTAFEEHHRALIQGQCLHAGELQLVHPHTGERLHLRCPLPPQMEKVVRLLFGKDVARLMQEKLSCTAGGEACAQSGDGEENQSE